MTKLELTKDEEQQILAQRKKAYEQQQYQLLRMSMLMTLLPAYAIWWQENGKYEPTFSTFYSSNEFNANAHIPNKLDRDLISDGEIHTIFQMLWIESKKIVTDRT